MSTAVSERDDDEPMMEVNMTPLIDVMLVLLIMFIITIPVQTHAVKIDLPVPNEDASNVDPEKNKLMISAAGVISWNDSPIDLALLAQYLEQTKARPVEPAHKVQPEPFPRHFNAPNGLAALQRNQTS